MERILVVTVTWPTENGGGLRTYGPFDTSRARSEWIDRKEKEWAGLNPTYTLHRVAGPYDVPGCGVVANDGEHTLGSALVICTLDETHLGEHHDKVTNQTWRTNPLPLDLSVERCGERFANDRACYLPHNHDGDCRPVPQV